MPSSKKTLVMGFGTFDGLHPGHVAFLKQLKKLGDQVLVVVARDQNVTRLKGKTPCFNEKKRLQKLQKSNLIDKGILGNKDDFYKCLVDHRPEVIGLGYDQKADTAAIQRVLPKVKIVRLKPFRPEQYKSSLLTVHKFTYILHSLED